MEKFSLIIVAAGQGLRMGSVTPKQYIPIAGKPLLRHVLDRFLVHPALKDVVVVIDPAHRSFYDQAVTGLSLPPPVDGGVTRRESVFHGLKALEAHPDDIVLIHDAARALISREDIDAVLDAMRENDAACLGSAVQDTLRYDQGTFVDRDKLWALQTPQAFRYGLLQKAHEQAQGEFTDDTGLVSALGIPVRLVQAQKPNLKITTPGDLTMAHALLTSSYEIRTGTGYDVHAFDETANVQSIRLFGLDIPFDRKLSGHSDADVALHALTDAILGAIGEGDIGLHFPPSDMAFKNMDSAVFLKHAMDLLQQKGGSLVNADITLICEKPKLGAYREKARLRVAEILNVSASRLNIKATTTEKLGFAGREEGIAAQAAVSVSLPAQGV